MRNLPPMGRYPSDDTPDGCGPDVEVFASGNGDWYLRVVKRDPLREPSEAVRFSTSGGRDDVVVMLIAALHSAMLGDNDATKLRCEAATGLLDCGRRLRRKDSPGMPPGQTTTERDTKGTLRGSVVEEASGGPGGAGPSDAGRETPAARGEARPARVTDTLTIPCHADGCEAAVVLPCAPSSEIDEELRKLGWTTSKLADYCPLHRGERP